MNLCKKKGKSYEMKFVGSTDLHRIVNLDMILRHWLSFAGKKSQRGPSFRLSSVNVNAKSVMAAEQELEALAACIPANKDERKWYDAFLSYCLYKLK